MSSDLPVSGLNSAPGLAKAGGYLQLLSSAVPPFPQFHALFLAVQDGRRSLQTAKSPQCIDVLEYDVLSLLSDWPTLFM